MSGQLFIAFNSYCCAFTVRTEWKGTQARNQQDICKWNTLAHYIRKLWSISAWLVDHLLLPLPLLLHHATMTQMLVLACAIYNSAKSVICWYCCCTFGSPFIWPPPHHTPQMNKLLGINYIKIECTLVRYNEDKWRAMNGSNKTKNNKNNNNKKKQREKTRSE